MSERMRDFVLGLATLAGLIGLAALLMFFGEVRVFRPPSYEITINMTLAAGLREGSPIELNGVRIGEIREIVLDPEARQYPVRAIAEISQERQIPEAVIASVDRSLLAGTATLELRTDPPPEDEPMAYIATDGTGELWVEGHTFLDQILTELDTRTEPLLVALENFNRLSETYTDLGRNVNALIGELPGANDEPNRDANTLRAAVVRLNEVLDDGRTALRLATDWLEDDQLRADVHHAVTSAHALIEQATDTFSHYGRLAESLERDAGAIVQNLVPITDELAATLDDVRRMTRLAVDGRGTIAQLLNNPELYESLLDASIRLERALAEAQLLIQKFQAEGVPVRW